MTDKFRNKTVVITGAAGLIGSSTAQKLSEFGAKLVLADTDRNGLKKLMEKPNLKNGNTISFPYQIKDKLGVNNLMHATNNEFGKIDILITCAGETATGDMFEISHDDLLSVFNSNVASIFLQVQLAARWMIEQRDSDPDFVGSIVNISSIASQRTAPERLPFSVSCAALEQLTRSLASNLASHNIRVNAVTIGSVRTKYLDQVFHKDKEMQGEMIAVTPLGRLGEASEAADAALFLASPAASFITGQVLAVDGGRLVLDPLSKTFQPRSD